MNIRARTLATALVLAAVIASGGTVGAGAPAGTPVRAVLDLSGYLDRTTTIPAGLPLPATATGIGPGSFLVISRPDGVFACTANFIWRVKGKKPSGDRLFLGAAGHCFLPVGETATHGAGPHFNAAVVGVRACVDECTFGGETGAIIEGTMVDLGHVAYARQTAGGLDVGNDFGIAEIPRALWSRVRAALPVFGGPAGASDAPPGQMVCHYGNGVVLGETFLTMDRVGIITSANPNSWLALALVAPGDSGSAIETCDAGTGGIRGLRAVGLITHIVAGDQGIAAGTTVARAIELAREAKLSITLVTAS